MHQAKLNKLNLQKLRQHADGYNYLQLRLKADWPTTETSSISCVMACYWSNL